MSRRAVASVAKQVVGGGGKAQPKGLEIDIELEGL